MNVSSTSTTPPPLPKPTAGGDDWCAGKLTEDEILARLFKLNQERANAVT